MVKFTATSDYNFDVSPVEIITDLSQLTKRASAKHLLKFDRTPNQTDIHLIALGAYEGTGQNRNGDLFSEEDCKKNYHTFKAADRAVHRHHKNKKKDPKYGNIKAAAYNEPMKRIELIVGLDNDKCADILDEQEKKGYTNWSMACVLDPEYPVLTSCGYKSIAKVEVGDLVLTHNGNWKKVTKAISYPYTGNAVQLHVNGLPNFPALTEDHLLFSTVFSQVNNHEKQFRYFRDSKEFDLNPPQWNHVRHLKPGDRLFYKEVPKVAPYTSIDDLDFAKLLGYYTAEGSLNQGVVSYSCNINDPMIKEIPEIVYRKFNERVTTQLHLSTVSKVAMNLNVYSEALKQIFEHYAGRSSHAKYICAELFNSSDVIKKTFLGAWLDGDGFTDKKGAHISSCNYSLILQGRDLLLTFGIPSSIYKIDHSLCETSGMSNSGVEYTLNVSWADAYKLAEYSNKIKESPYCLDEKERKSPACLRPCAQQLYAYRIKEVEVFFVENTPVYNLEVEDDHSYTLAGIISHNCKIAHDTCTWCGHNAKNDAERCEHIPTKLGELNAEGVMCGMANPNPNWFEISYVHRPADRIGMSLKVASDERIRPMLPSDFLKIYDGFEVPEDELYLSKKAADKRAILKKLSEMEKHLDAVSVKHPKDTKDSFLARQARLKDSKKIEKGDMDELRKHEPSKAFKALADDGVILGPEEFCEYAFGNKINPEMTKGMKTHLPKVYSKMDENGEGDVVNDEKFEPAGLDFLPKELRSLVGKLFEGHSLFGEPSVRRVMRITIEMGPKEDKDQLFDKVEPTSNKGDEKLAEAYASYKLASLNYLNDNGKLTDELLWNALIQNR